MAGRPKGIPKTGGRKKGVENKITESLKEFYVSLMDRERDYILDALEKLRDENPQQYLMAIDKISQKVIANKKDITSDDQSIVPQITIIEHRNQSE